MNNERMLSIVRDHICSLEHLRYKWEGEYGRDYPMDVQTGRIKDINSEIDALRKDRDELKIKLKP